MKHISSSIIAVLFAAFVVAGAVWAFTEPTQAPPAGNVLPPINTGPAGQDKEGGLSVNSGGAATGFVVNAGKVGFGTTTPQADFELYSPAADYTAMRITNGLTTKATWELRSHQTVINNGFSITEMTDCPTCAQGPRLVITKYLADGTGNRVGIDTADPQSKLQIVGGYLQIDTTTSEPPIEDCNDPEEVGRMIVERGPGKLWVCSSGSNWVSQ